MSNISRYLTSNNNDFATPSLERTETSGDTNITSSSGDEVEENTPSRTHTRTGIDLKDFYATEYEKTPEGKDAKRKFTRDTSSAPASQINYFGEDHIGTVAILKGMIRTSIVDGSVHEYFKSATRIAEGEFNTMENENKKLNKEDHSEIFKNIASTTDRVITENGDVFRYLVVHNLYTKVYEENKKNNATRTSTTLRIDELQQTKVVVPSKPDGERNNRENKTSIENFLEKTWEEITTSEEYKEHCREDASYVRLGRDATLLTAEYSERWKECVEIIADIKQTYNKLYNKQTREYDTAKSKKIHEDIELDGLLAGQKDREFYNTAFTELLNYYKTVSKLVKEYSGVYPTLQQTLNNRQTYFMDGIEMPYENGNLYGMYSTLQQEYNIYTQAHLITALIEVANTRITPQMYKLDPMAPDAVLNVFVNKGSINDNFRKLMTPDFVYSFLYVHIFPEGKIKDDLRVRKTELIKEALKSNEQYTDLKIYQELKQLHAAKRDVMGAQENKKARRGQDLDMQFAMLAHVPDDRKKRQANFSTGKEEHKYDRTEFFDYLNAQMVKPVYKLEAGELSGEIYVKDKYYYTYKSKGKRDQKLQYTCTIRPCRQCSNNMNDNTHIIKCNTRRCEKCNGYGHHPFTCKQKIQK